MRLFQLVQKQIWFGLLEFTQMFITCKSEWTSSNLLKWFELYLCLSEAVSISQIVLRLLECTQMFLIVSKFHWSSCIKYDPHWMKLFAIAQNFNKAVPLGPNLNRAIAVCWKLISSVRIYSNFSNSWKYS